MAIDLTGQGFQETVNDAIDVKYGLMDPLEYAAKGSLAERATANIGLNMRTALAAIPVAGMVLGKLGKGIAKAERKADDVPGASAVKRYDEAYSAPGASKRSTAAREADNLTLSRSRAAGDAPGSARAQRTAVSRPKGDSALDEGAAVVRSERSYHVGMADERGRLDPINPRGADDNCTACTTAALRYEMYGENLTADAVETIGGTTGRDMKFSVADTQYYIETNAEVELTKVSRVASPDAPPGHYVGIFEGETSGHVLYARKFENGRFMIHDRQVNRKLFLNDPVDFEAYRRIYLSRFSRKQAFYLATPR